METCHSSNSDKRFILISSDQLVQHAKDKWNLEDPFYCNYNIVATLGTPVSGKSKCISTTSLYKLTHRNQQHFSMIYLALTLPAVMLMAM
jgi:hypothetical protein